MSGGEFGPVAHADDALLARAMRRKGFVEAYEGLVDDYDLARRLLKARLDSGLTQEEVARRMGTTKSAVSRLEGPAKHSPSLSTLRRYGQAVGCEIELRLVPRAGESASTEPLSLRRR